MAIEIIFREVPLGYPMANLWSGDFFFLVDTFSYINEGWVWIPGSLLECWKRF